MTILRRLPGERYSEVQRAWEGEAAAILACGPSLTAQQADIVHAQGLRVIAINDSYLLAPWADVCYFADSRWWEWHTKGIARSALGLSADQVRKRFAEFPGQKCSILWSGSNIEDEAVHILRCKRQIEGDEHGGGLSSDPKMLVSGRSSGYQALNLAILAGASPILLLGYDGKPDAAGRNHWFGEHPSPTLPASYEQQRRMFSQAEAAIMGACVEVINCNPASAIDSFPKKSLEQLLR